MNLSLIVLIISSFLLSCDKQKSPMESASKAPTNSALTELDSRIPPDDSGTYKSVQDASDWQNPYLVIQRDGVALKCLAISKKEWQIILPEELAKRLIELPVEAWPYGRVIAVQEIAIRSRNDDRDIAANKAKVEMVLKALGVRFNGWPSA